VSVGGESPTISPTTVRREPRITTDKPFRPYGSSLTNTADCNEKRPNFWAYVAGFIVGIFVTLALTILASWLINTATSHSSWLRQGFYGWIFYGQLSSY